MAYYTLEALLPLVIMRGCLRPAGVSEVIITYYSVDDDTQEADEIFYFTAWVAGNLEDRIVAETVIVDND
ncbi:hypothetical protein [Shewanella psychrophila]|uniref:hypothetical protein n=1 Tax=Shewanella psychrophila TaxID=225848 RepID=UPI00098A5FB2|nr:hypothetical protein [Shewanella psychrophila]